MNIWFEVQKELCEKMSYWLLIKLQGIIGKGDEYSLYLKVDLIGGLEVMNVGVDYRVVCFCFCKCFLQRVNGLLVKLLKIGIDRFIFQVVI